MNKKIKVGFVTIVILSVLVLVACQREGAPGGSDYLNGDDELDGDYIECDLEVEIDGDDDGLNGDASDYEINDDESPDTEDMSDGDVIISVYAPDANFINFEAVDVSITSLTYSNVLKALVEQGILPQDVRILSFGNTIVDGGKMLEIDFSDDFSRFLGNQGTSGEFLTLGGVVNTFLDAFGGDKVKITIEGAPLASPHMGEVLEPLSWFGN